MFRRQIIYSLIMDCYNGEILTVEMRDNMKKELCMDTVHQLKQRYGNLQGGSITQRQRKSIHKRGISEIIKKLRNNAELKRNRTLL